MDRTRKIVGEALKRAHIPFLCYAGDLAAFREGLSKALRATLYFQDYQQPDLSFRGVETRLESDNPNGLSGGEANFEMELIIREDKGQLCGGLAYATALFEEETAARFLASYIQTLHQLATAQLFDD